MTIAVDLGRKATKQTNKTNNYQWYSCDEVFSGVQDEEAAKEEEPMEPEEDEEKKKKEVSHSGVSRWAFPPLLAHPSRRLMGIPVTPLSVRPQFQTSSPLKPLGQ